MLFPGWKRPGLIEASMDYTPRQIAEQDFRGGNAPASLKPQRKRPRIKSVVADFRGGNAPASLKLVRGIEGARGRYLFPGWKRPGLIEATATTCSTSCTTKLFPGWKRPGLIEAHTRFTNREGATCDFRGGNAPASLKHCVDSVAIALENFISGVETPRPH